MAKIYLIRHAKSEANKNEIFAGITDYPLCEEGFVQAEELKNKIISLGLHFDKIYSSPLKRTIQTITPTAKALNLKIAKNINFIEMDVGDWEDLTFSQIYEKNKKIVEHIISTDEFVGISNQETHEEVADRMYCEIMELVQKNINKNLVIVSHSIAIRSLLCKILSINFCDIKEKLGTLDNASITTLNFDDLTQEFKMLSYNL